MERQLVDWLQSELSLTSLTRRTSLTDWGIDSLKAVEIVNVLPAAFDHTFPATSMLHHPTVASPADLIPGTKLGHDTGQLGCSGGDASAAEQIDTEALATAYTTGHRLDFAARRPRPYRSLALPTYPFQRRAYWFPATTAPAPKGRTAAIESSPAEAERTTP